MSENKKTNEERQKEVDRQLELMKAAIGDDNFSDSDDDSSDSEDSQELQERSTNGKNAAMESARKFLWDEADEDDDKILLGGPFPTNPSKPAAVAPTIAEASHMSNRSGMFGVSLFGRGSGVMSDDDGYNINLMDASAARASSASSSNNSRQRPSLSNLFLRGSPNMATSWNDAGARDSEEFIHEGDKKSPSYLNCLGWTFMWALTLGLLGIFGYYVYDFVQLLKLGGPSATMVTPTTTSSEIQQALINAGALLPVQLQDPNSPQNSALRWITQDGMAADNQFLSQRYSLAVLYYSMNGQHWTHSDNWLSKDHGYCQWYGVQCLGTLTLIEQTNNNGPVFELNLSSNKLKGSIPKELNNFHELFFLDLQDNQLEGTIPNDLGGWTGLRMFSVARNQLYGSLPATLFTTSPELHIFNAGHNKFSGTIPSVLGQVTTLREVRLEYNDLDGSIPASFHALDRVETLHLAGNKIQGSLPPAIYDMDRLESLYLHDNRLTGQLSTEFARLSHLELLTLNHNELVGTVPDVFAKTRFLQELRLHENEFTGTMPNSICSLTKTQKLTHLSVDCTKTDAVGELGVHCDCCTECM